MQRLTESIIDHAAITLVIAHPDDECMFFYPTISRAKRLHIICLSNGGYDGLGEEREEELQRAARRLGASATCVNNAALQDGPHAWDPSVVAANVGPWLHAGAVVVTFDRYGASGHANHVAVYHGAAPASLARRGDGVTRARTSRFTPSSRRSSGDNAARGQNAELLRHDVIVATQRGSFRHRSDGVKKRDVRRRPAARPDETGLPVLRARDGAALPTVHRRAGPGVRRRPRAFRSAPVRARRP